MTICIIPARYNSKRIKEKNIKILKGKPLIGHVIHKLKKTKIFTRIIVSTDNLKIAKIAKKFGAEVPFLRSKKLSDDYTPTYKVLVDCVKKIKSQNNEFHFCVYPTSIFINKDDLKKGFTKIKKTKSNCLVTIKKFEPSPLRSLKIKKNNIFFSNSKYQISRSQDLQNLFYDTGSFYIYKTKSLLNLTSKKSLPNKTTYLILKHDTIDINNESDLKAAKKIFKIN